MSLIINVTLKNGMCFLFFRPRDHSERVFLRGPRNVLSGTPGIIVTLHVLYTRKYVFSRDGVIAICNL